MIDQLKVALAEKKFQQIEDLVKSLGLKWQETGLFSLADETIPKLGEAGTFGDLFALNSQNKYPNKLILSSTSHYLARLKEKMTNPNTKESNSPQAAQGFMRDVWQGWIEQNKKKMKIERNVSLLGDE